jgi:acetylglutamate kinase
MSKITEEEIKKILPLKGPSFEEVKNYLKKYNDEYIVIKCGGSVLVDQNLFNNFINDISILNKLGFIPIIIHGGGKRISDKLHEAGIKSNFLNGLRVTDKKSISIVEEVLNSFNKEITEALKKNRCDSQGITNKLNNILFVEEENKELGFVGTPKEINKIIIEKIVREKKVPVIAPLGLGKNNQVYNINADTAAGAIAKKLNARRLIIMSDVEGVLDAKKKLLSEIDTDKVNDLIKNNIISGGMLPKIKNCLDVASNGVKGVCIIDGRLDHSILFELLSNAGSGTLIRE